MTDKQMIDEALRSQVANQCRAIAALAEALRNLHLSNEKLFRLGHADELLKMEGIRTASLMERLGDELNNMDAWDEAYDWVNPVFKEAHRLFPIKQEGEESQYQGEPIFFSRTGHKIENQDDVFIRDDFHEVLDYTFNEIVELDGYSPTSKKFILMNEADEIVEFDTLDEAIAYGGTPPTQGGE